MLLLEQMTKLLYIEFSKPLLQSSFLTDEQVHVLFIVQVHHQRRIGEHGFKFLLDGAESIALSVSPHQLSEECLEDKSEYSDLSCSNAGNNPPILAGVHYL